MIKYDFPWEPAAMNGEAMPDDLSLAEQCAFEAISLLYARFRLKAIDRENGHLEKLRIKKAFEARRATEDFDSKMAKYRAYVIKKTEQALSAYFREPTIENADKMAEAFQGAMLRNK